MAGVDQTQLVPSAWQARTWQALSWRPWAGVLVGLLLGLAAAGAALGVTLSGRTSYHSTTVLLIDNPYQLATAGDQGQILKLDQLRGKYASLVGTDLIAGPVARRLGLPVGQVISSVAAGSAPGSLLIDVVATTYAPSQAPRLSGAVADELTSYVRAEEATYGVPAADRFFLRTAIPTTGPVANRPSRTRALTWGVGFGVLGLVVGFTGAQLVSNRRLLG